MPDRQEEILKTLEEIEEGKGQTLSGTFWRAKYEQDVKWLMKDRLAKLDQLLKFREEIKKIWTIVEEQGKTLKEVQKKLLGS